MPAMAPIDRGELTRRLERYAYDARERGDQDLNRDMAPYRPFRSAAVLVPFVDRPEGLTILFTQRTAHLASHAGQISFPGGGREPQDADGVDTALRETHEEIGIEPDRVTVIGRLDTYITRTGFIVEPYAGLLRPPLGLTPDPKEVAEVFEVPLTFILDDANPVIDSVKVAGAQRQFYAFPYYDRYIWGATAGMLVNLREVLLTPC